MITLTRQEAVDLERVVDRLLHGHHETGGGLHVLGDREFKRIAHLALSELRGKIHDERWNGEKNYGKALHHGS